MKYKAGNDKPFEYGIDAATPEGMVNTNIVVTQTKTMRDYILELLNNPPMIPRPADPMHQTAFMANGKAHVVRGSKAACDAVDELAKFFVDYCHGNGVIPPVEEGRPHFVQRKEEDPITELFRRVTELSRRDTELSRRVRELERNLHALAVRQPRTTRDYNDQPPGI